MEKAILVLLLGILLGRSKVVELNKNVGVSVTNTKLLISGRRYRSFAYWHELIAFKAAINQAVEMYNLPPLTFRLSIDICWLSVSNNIEWYWRCG